MLKVSQGGPCTWAEEWAYSSGQAALEREVAFPFSVASGNPSGACLLPKALCLEIAVLAVVLGQKSEAF